MLSGLAQRRHGLAAPRANRAACTLLAVLVLALQFGPLVGLIGFRLTDDPQWALNGAVRDAAVLALAAIACGHVASGARAALPGSARWALATVAGCALFALLTEGGDPLVLALNLRRLALMPLLFVALLVIPWTPAQIDRLFGLVVGTGVLVALLGIGERLAPEQLWTELLDISRYTAATGADRFGALAFEDTGRFFSWDVEAWSGAPWRRMISSYLEPTTLAAAMAAMLVAALARRARGHGAGLVVGLAVACGLATLSKGFALFLLALLGWRWLGVPSPRHVLVLAIAGCVAALAAGPLQLDGPLVHVSGLASSLHYLAGGGLAGEGVGNAGNYAAANSELGEESGLGNTIGQVGLAALLPLFWVAALARDVLGAAAARRDPGGPWLAAWSLFWGLSYLFSASSLGVGGNALGFALAALYLHPASGARGR